LKVEVDDEYMQNNFGKIKRDFLLGVKIWESLDRKVGCLSSALASAHVNPLVAFSFHEHIKHSRGAGGRGRRVHTSPMLAV